MGDTIHGYETYDAILYRDGWESAFQQLAGAIKANIQGMTMDLRELEEHYGLGEGWTWADLHQEIMRSDNPEEEFRRVLGYFSRELFE